MHCWLATSKGGCKVGCTRPTLPTCGVGVPADRWRAVSTKRSCRRLRLFWSVFCLLATKGQKTPQAPSPLRFVLLYWIAYWKTPKVLQFQTIP